MNKRRVIENIFSNWASLVVGVAIAFFVTPIVVHTLGTELYGIWILIASLTGYFSVLDFGVNTALVRFISSSDAQNDHEQAQKVYSTSLAIFAVFSSGLLIFSLIFGFFFQSIFGLGHLSHFYLYAVFLAAAIDFAFGLLFSVFRGSLSGLQEFKFINGSSIVVNIVKSIAVVYLLEHGYGLLTLALVQVVATLARAFCQYWRIKIRYTFLRFRRDLIQRDTIKLLYSYSVYSFMIAIALKLLFYTDALVIGSMIGVSEVTFYSIPASILDYFEKFIWAMIAVLVPVISSNDATGEGNSNSDLYIQGTRYSLLLIVPMVTTLYFFGSNLIYLWVGPEIGSRSEWVLKFLLIGFGIATSQLIAHGILKGISRHKVLAYILSIEALANFGLSIALARTYGIEGVAFGTMLPLIVATVVIVVYTCRLLQLKLLVYLYRAYAGAAVGLLMVLVVTRFMDMHAYGYVNAFLKCGVITLVFLSIALPSCLKFKFRESLGKESM